mgnify:CR=1 FL=1
MRPVAFVCAFVATPLLAASAPPTPFTNATEESGVAAVVRAHYATVPKWWLSGIDLTDLDGDGDLDLHLGGHGSPAAAASNDGKGHFTYVDPKLAVPRGVRAGDDLPYPGGEIRLAHDFDEDGKLDILASWHDAGGVLYRNACQPDAWNFTRPRTLDHFNRACAIADLDRDGIADYLADEGGRDSRKVLLFRGKSGGSFGPGTPIEVGAEETCPIPVDLDGDGDLDFLISRRGYNPPGRRILRNDGNLRFADITADAGLNPEGGSIHGVGDLDLDGDFDLICIEGAKPPLRLALYLNDGQGRFAAKPDAIAGGDKLRLAHTNWGGAVATDLDNDGTPDLLINGRHFFYALRGLGGGRFEVANEAWGLPAGAWSAVDEGLCFGDMDGDGDLDIVACGRGPEGREKGVEVFRNDLPRQHWLRVRLLGAKGNRCAAGAKIEVFEAGTRKRWGHEQVAIWGRQSFHSYYAASATERHFGLGTREAVEVAVEFYPSRRRVEQSRVKADSVVEIREP